MLKKQLLFSEMKGRLLIIPLICSIFYFPILYAGVFFLDDIYRINVQGGGFAWEGQGRFLASVIAYIYSGTTKIVIDAYPFTWFLNIFLLSFSSYLIYVKLSQVSDNLASWISVLLLINPFFTYNLLYRFDSTGMTFAITFAVFAFFVPENNKYFFGKAVLLLISLNFYQPGCNIFLSLYALLLFLSISKTNTSNFLKIFLYAILVYGIATIIYYIELKLFTTTGRARIFSLDKHLFIRILNSNIKAISPFIEFWRYYKWYILPIIPFSIIGLLAYFKKKTFLFLFLSFLLFAMSILGGMSILRESNYFDQGRVLNYFPFIIVFLFLGLNKLGIKFKYLVFLPVLACFLFNFRVGNVLRIQNLYEQPIFYSVSNDIYKLPEIKKFYVLGGVPISSFAKNLVQHTPFGAYLNRISWNSAFRINEYTSRELVEDQWIDLHSKIIKQFRMLKNTNELELVKYNKPFYCIYKHNDIGFIDWGCETYEEQ